MNARPWLGVNTSLVDVSGRMGTASGRPGGAAWLNPGGSTAPAPAAPTIASQSRREKESLVPCIVASQGKRHQRTAGAVPLPAAALIVHRDRAPSEMLRAEAWGRARGRARAPRTRRIPV